MDRMIKLLLPTSLIIVLAFFLFDNENAAVTTRPDLVKEAKSVALSEYFQKGELPQKVLIREREFNFNSTINEKLQNKVEKLLKRFRSDYSAIVVIDNETGKILASAGYEGRAKKQNYHLPFSTTHPSASLFKIVTSAKLLEEKRITPETKLQYRGKGTTLYKYQLKDKNTRWTRTIPFRKAFAYSNNVVFGKAAVNNLTGIELFDMAYKFGFNRDIVDGMQNSRSVFQMPEGQYNLAELASGFNSETRMSPLHAAAMAMIIAREGTFKKPTIFEKERKSGENKSWRVITPETARDLKKLMAQTVASGTAKKSFRRMKRSLKKSLEIGGKTGSLTGGLPEGKRDWFSSYAVPRKNKAGKGISIAIMNINVKKWYVKSAFLAKEIISYYFTKINPLSGKQDTLVARKY